MVCELAPPRLGLFGRGRALGFPESTLTAAVSPDVRHPGGAPWLGGCPATALSSSRDMALGLAPVDLNSLSSVGGKEMRRVLVDGGLLAWLPLTPKGDPFLDPKTLMC